MAIDFRAALRYPFSGSNVFHAWLIPGTLILLVQALTFGVILGARQAFPQLTQPQLVLLSAPFTIVLNLLLGGFYWHMAHQLQTQGYQAPVESWQQAIGAYFKDGAKLFPYLILVNVLLTLLLGLPIFVPTGTDVTAGLLMALLIVGLAIVVTPFLVAPVIQSAQTYRLKDLFNFKKTAAFLKGTYRQGLIAMLMAFPVLAVYILLMALLMMMPITSILLPYAIMAMMVTTWHLLNQGLSTQGAWQHLGTTEA